MAYNVVANKFIHYFTEKKKSCVGDTKVVTKLKKTKDSSPSTPAEYISNVLYTLYRNRSTKVLIMLNL